MEGHRHRSAKRRHKKPRPRAAGSTEPVLIVARRPGAPPRPNTPRSMIAASAVPRSFLPAAGHLPASNVPDEATAADLAPKRAARIVQPPARGLEVHKDAPRLLARLLASAGRGAITHAADALLAAGIELPLEQAVQLQLLEHVDERRARTAVAALATLLAREAPIRRPVLEQRLRRLEEHAEDVHTRDAAASLRRTLRC